MSYAVYILTNIVNGRVYVGHTRSVKTRITQHFNRLKKRNHYSWEMQNDYDKGHLITSEIVAIKDNLLEARQLECALMKTTAYNFQRSVKTCRTD